ncbi:MAG: zinc ABC transporter substrate-binding protein [Spirochaetales bacterium]|nr:zinc ABC transporter substrate-binding protein [Spirochaetales bacterium]
MNRKKIISVLLLIAVMMVPVFASGQQEASGSENTVEPAEDSTASSEKSDSPIKVFVSIVPQAYFVEKIAGDRAEIEIMVPPGKGPATYEPTPGQVTELASAKAFFTIGVPFENAFLPKVKDSLPDLNVVDTSAGVTRRHMGAHHHEDEEEAEEEEHEEGGLDPHIWLSPALVKIQAQNIYDALVALDPAGESEYTAGLNELNKELDGLSSRIEKELAPYKGKIFFIFHPALGYFADQFGLKQIAIESGGKEPSAEAIGNIIDNAKNEGVKVIFVQPEFSEKAAGVIAEAIDGSVVKLNPLSSDYINNLDNIAEKIKVSYE